MIKKLGTTFDTIKTGCVNINSIRIGKDTVWESNVTKKYIQDGLVFMLDCGYECTTSKWTDLVGGLEFTGNGNVTFKNNAPYFNESAWYNISANLPYAWNTCTIEAAFVREKSGRFNLIDNNASGKIGILFYSYWQGVGSNGVTTPRYTAINGIGTFTTMSFSNPYAYENKTKMSQYGTDYWGASSSGTTIGGGREKFKGTLYAIRIYNRLLTESEIMINQDLDIKRFGSL